MTTKNRPYSRPTNFFSAKISPKSLGDFFLEKSLPNAKKIHPNGEILPNLVTLTFVESVNTFIQSHTFAQSLLF
jgi:hypothetical protein